MIDMSKQYRYRNGGAAKVISVTAIQPYSVVTQDEAGDIWRHTETGQFYTDGRETVHNLIEVIPLWSGKVWVRDVDGACIGHATTDPGFRPITAVEKRKENA